MPGIICEALASLGFYFALFLAVQAIGLVIEIAERKFSDDH